MLGDLSSKYESNGDPACISTGWGDAGGKSYGMYQLASNTGSVERFTDYLDEVGYDNQLKSFPIGSEAFDKDWQFYGCADRENFAKLQHDFIKREYYDKAVKILADNYFHIENHSEVMKDVIWSRAVQYGAGNILEMFTDACKIMGYPNLSYIDAENFDRDLIKAIYLGVCHTEEWTNGSPSLRVGLYYRFETECEDALNLL